MTAATQTLSAWLLDQIAEDEAMAREIHDPADYRPGKLIPSEGEGYIFITVRRALAECEAKRKVIESLGDYKDRYVWSTIEAYRALDALRALTLPYADRPGFRQEWNL